MAVYRCTQCEHVAEVPQLQSGARAYCQQCNHPVTMLDAQMLMQSLISRHGKLLKEVDNLRGSTKQSLEPASATPTNTPQTSLALLTDLQRQQAHADVPFLVRKLVDLGLRVRWDQAQYSLPLHELKAAALLAECALIIKPHLEHIRYGYKQGWSTINLILNLTEKSQRPKLARLMFELYDRGFFEHYRSEFAKDALSLGLHPSQSIRKFFDTEWLELWLYFHLVRSLQTRGIRHVAGRNLLIEGEKKKLHSLDIICVVNERELIAIAGSTRDHRLDLDRFETLNELISQSGGTFFICDPTCDEIRAAELSAYYELPFLNLDSTLNRIKEIGTQSKQLAGPTPPQYGNIKSFYRA